VLAQHLNETFAASLRSWALLRKRPARFNAGSVMLNERSKTNTASTVATGTDVPVRVTVRSAVTTGFADNDTGVGAVAPGVPAMKETWRKPIPPAGMTTGAVDTATKGSVSAGKLISTGTADRFSRMICRFIVMPCSTLPKSRDGVSNSTSVGTHPVGSVAVLPAHAPL
jgi:hypothetical protein